MRLPLVLKSTRLGLITIWSICLSCLTHASAQDCVVSPPDSYESAIGVMFDPIRIVDPVAATGTKGSVPTAEFTVPAGTESLTFEYTFCTASEPTFFTSGDEVRFGTYDPIFVIEQGRAITGNVIAIGLQPGDLSNNDAAAFRTNGESFSVTDTVTFDIAGLASGDYTVQVLQGLPWVYADDLSSVHQDSDLMSFWETAIVMTIPVPEPSVQTGVLSGLLCLCGLKRSHKRGVAAKGRA